MIDKLIKRIDELNNPTVVGLDPRLDFIPKQIKDKYYATFGKNPVAAAKAIYEFNIKIIDKIHDIVPAVKPQIAMYEQFGAEGIKTYVNTIRYARDKGLIVIGDIKRSDIASTAKAYSQGHIGEVAIEDTKHTIYKADFITLNPYLGIDSIEPYLEDCAEFDKGLFVLVKTSNPNSGQIQDLDVDGEKLYEKVGKLVEDWGSQYRGEYGYSDVGAVVGATHPEQGKRLREILPHTFFLVPGYGAQGATAKDLRGCFDKEGRGAIVNSSRGIIAAYTKEKYKEFGEAGFAKAARQACIDMREDLKEALSE